MAGRTVNTTDGARVDAQSLVEDAPDLQDQIADAKDEAELGYLSRQAFRKTLAALQAEPKQSVRVPQDPNNPWRKKVTVQINGVKVDVPVGKRVKVPESVASAIENSDYLG